MKHPSPHYDTLLDEVKRLRSALEHIADLPPGYNCDPATAAIERFEDAQRRITTLEAALREVRSWVELGVARVRYATIYERLARIDAALRRRKP